ncbi:hypothetical protein BUE76_18155 [Cnuella takakiae]|nr:hypothetical protein BUE76_18155 [Cnuella takakiae]
MVSCIKERDMNIDPAKGVANMLGFTYSGDDVAGSSSVYSRFTSDLGSLKANQTVSFPVNVSYMGQNEAPADITLNLAVDTEVLTQFNSENGTNYVVPDASIFKLPATAVIKKGTRTTQVKVEVTNNASFDFNKNYALPLKITSASSGAISSNLGKAVYSFSARNQYDGLYVMEATGPMVDVTSAALTGYYPLNMYLITYSGNSVALFDADGVYSKNYFHPIVSGGTSVSAYGSFSPIFTFDASGKVTSVSNYYGQESGGNKRSGMLDPTGVNKITFNADGSVKQIEVSYIMTQSVASPFAPRTYFKEKFTYKGQR